MLKALNPTTVAAPFSNYAHAVKVPAGASWLHISGQVGVARDGAVPDDFAGQCEQAFRNLLAILDEAGMDVADVVRINTYLTDAADIAAYRGIRDRMLQNHATASTLLVVAGLATPKLKVEIEAVAAKL